MPNSSGAWRIVVLQAIGGGGLARSGNRLLRGLSVCDQHLILDDVRQVRFPRGTIVMAPSAAIENVYFPETGLVTIEEAIADRGHVEVALVGNEGLIGWPAVLGSRRTAHRATIQGNDAVLHVITATALLGACQSSPTLLAALLSFVQAITVQMSRAIVTHLESPLGQRVARWLLMRHDRIVGDQIIVRHDEIASGLNTRRASVTDQLHLIEGERLISGRRGRIFILDRIGLEDFAGEAFGVAEAEYRHLLGAFGKSR